MTARLAALEEGRAAMEEAHGVALREEQEAARDAETKQEQAEENERAATAKAEQANKQLGTLRAAREGDLETLREQAAPRPPTPATTVK